MVAESTGLARGLLYMSTVMQTPIIALAPIATEAVSNPSPQLVASGTHLKEVLVGAAAGPDTERLCEQLVSEGHTVRAVHDGQEALQILQGPTAPSIALLDEDLPGINGSEVIRRLRGLRTERYVYTVLLVAYQGRAATLRGRETGADDCLGKPVYLRELQAYLHTARRIVAMERRLAEARDRFRTQATRDPLTGLANRMHIMETLDREVQRTERQHTPVSVIMVDLDHFKRINDTHGHPAGDEVLRQASARMNDAIRSYDAVGRYGGEEFIVVLPGADLKTASIVAERLRRAISDCCVRLPTGNLQVTASLGVSAIGGGVPIDPEELVKRADAALYQAKDEGRNRVVCAQSERPRVLRVTDTSVEFRAELM